MSKDFFTIYISESPNWNNLPVHGGPHENQSFSNHENNEGQISESHIWNHPPPYSQIEQGKLMITGFTNMYTKFVRF